MVRLYKQKARRLYADFMSDPSSNVRDMMVAIQANLTALRNKFGKTSDEVHEYFSFQCELNKYAEFNFGN